MSHNKTHHPRKSILWAVVLYSCAMGLTYKAWAMSKNAQYNRQTASQSASQATGTGALPGDIAARPDQVWVYKSDESKSCGKEKGISLDPMSSELKKLGVQVFAQKKSHDNKMRIQMCGADKGSMNGFLIQKADIEKAVAAGFKTLSP